MNTRRPIGSLMRGQKQLESAISQLRLAKDMLSDPGVEAIWVTLQVARTKLAQKITAMEREYRKTQK
jgi:hypothetical protein